MNPNYDIIIIGAGSVGVPTSLALSKNRIKILVIDSNSSPGQGDNKKAIGGVRATHSEFSKMMIGKRSLEIFSTWEELNGDNIEWNMGGYLFPIYGEIEKNILTKLIPKQQSAGLKISFIKKNATKSLVPGINTDNLVGSVYSPEDGTTSPLLSINAFAKKSIKYGVKFSFKETVKKLVIEKGKVIGLKTDKSNYNAPLVIDASGKYSSTICGDINVKAELHEAGITEPVRKIFDCMVVDLRVGNKSKNFYFYQNVHGQVIFCITPEPSIFGTDNFETSTFLPQSTKRLLRILPVLANVRVRRIWRGCYPITLDGLPIVGWSEKISGLFHATGMCGQGFMLGPGLGELIERIINNKQVKSDKKIQQELTPKRNYSKQEVLK